jgi:hypothetical protein
MLNLFGPQLLEVIDFDNSENLIFIDDHMCLDESVDFDIRFVNHLKKLMDADNNIHKKIIVEYANSHDFLDYADRFLSVPAQTISSCSEVNFFVPDTAWTEKTSAFNFSINKLRVNFVGLNLSIT